MAYAKWSGFRWEIGEVAAPFIRRITLAARGIDDGVAHAAEVSRRRASTAGISLVCQQRTAVGGAEP